MPLVRDLLYKKDREKEIDSAIFLISLANHQDLEIYHLLSLQVC